MNFVTAPLIAVLFLLAAQCIHGKEVHDGIIGTDGYVPVYPRSCVVLAKSILTRSCIDTV